MDTNRAYLVKSKDPVIATKFVEELEDRREMIIAQERSSQDDPEGSAIPNSNSWNLFGRKIFEQSSRLIQFRKSLSSKFIESTSLIVRF